MSTPIIPVLMTGMNRLTKPEDIIKHILQHYTHAPKNINDSFPEYEISLVYDIAAASHNIDAMRGLSSASLSSVLSRYFSIATVDVEAELRDTDDGYYSLSFDIMVVVDGVTYSLSQEFSTDKEGNLIYEYTG